MISAWWLIPAAMIGAFIGAVMMGFVCANDMHKNDKKWWEE